MAKHLSDMRTRTQISDPMPRRIEPCLALLVSKGSVPVWGEMTP